MSVGTKKLENYATTPSNILCCMCGISMPPNPANMCINCITGRVDVTEGIQKNITIFWCKGCSRYLNPPNYWLVADLESKELLSFCLKRIRGLNKVRLIDANFIYTEPHSKRLKMKVTIQKEVFSGTILQQDVLVEFVVVNHFCPECHRSEAKDTWKAVAQVRQKVDHKRTFLWLEQMIIKHKAENNMTSIKETPDGLDFYFVNQNDCVKFLNFLQSSSAIKYKQAKKLVSSDVKSNTFNHKHSYSIEIPPICKEDLVILPLRVAQSHGTISQLVVCYKVTNVLHFVDPFTAQICDLSTTYWHNPFRSVGTRERLVEFIVLDIELISRNPKFGLAEVTVAALSDFGKNDKTYFTHTHLGNILYPGNTVLGYNLENAVFNDENMDRLKKNNKIRYDIVLVRKTYEKKRKAHRNWKLKKLTIEPLEDKDKKKGYDKIAQQHEEEFLADIEQDTELRSQINLYKDPYSIKQEENKEENNEENKEEDDDDEDDELPEIKEDELIDEQQN